MKFDPTPTSDQQDEPLTLLEEFSLKANNSLDLARKHLGNVRRFFHRRAAPAVPPSPPAVKIQLPAPRVKEQVEPPQPPKDSPSSAGEPDEPQSPATANLLPSSEKPEKEPSADSGPGNLTDPPPRSTVLLLSDDRKVIDAHPACSVLLGWEPGELLGKAAGELFEKGADLLLEQLLKMPDEDTEEEREPSVKEPVDVVALKKDGTNLPVKLTFRRCVSLKCWSVLLRPVDEAGEKEKTPESARVNEPVAPCKETSTAGGLTPAAQEPSRVPGVEAAGGASKSEAAKVSQSERDMLVGRLMANETELHLMRVRLEREAKKRKELEKKMEELTAAKAEPEKPATEQSASKQSELKDGSTINQQQTTDSTPPPAGTAPSQSPAAGAASPAENKQISGGQGDLAQEVVAHEVDLVEMERRLRASVASLARVTADFEKERSERRRCDQRATSLAAQLETLHHEFGSLLQAQQLDQQRITELKQEQLKSEEALNQAKADLQKETAGRELAEEQLRGLAELSARLEANLLVVEEAKRAFKRAEEQMELRLKTSAKALDESESKLQNEIRERQRLEGALAQAQRELQRQAAQSRMEISKLEASRHQEELERQGIDGDKLRSHLAEMESRREGHELVNSLRQQMRSPLDGLHRSVCQLLQAELPETTQQELRALLEPILLLQMTLQQPAAPNPGAESRPGESQPATNPVQQPQATP